jgi:hypothetical protein
MGLAGPARALAGRIGLGRATGSAQSDIFFEFIFNAKTNFRKV